MEINVQGFDRSALKCNQIAIVGFVGSGFVFDQPILPAFVAVVLLAGSFLPAAALFKQIYRYVIKPLGIMKPDVAHENPAPHQFAQLLGGLVLAAGSVLLYSGSSAAGWALAWIVILLAITNLLFGFCAGCFVYFQLAKRNIPGFHHSSS